MGIPKFFRYISERYPLTSQIIEENKIPEFDNLYLDFNGIIHNCSHPNDADAHFRLSEEQIFTSIFAYVDLLFSKIKPQKLFFMAVDGVAPRAKMNQQRSRRFRTAKEAKEVKEKAERNGEVLPEEKAFDSNCITPGTPFMARLSSQLQYFIHKKISEDANWRDVQVVLSGHEVPGEGEHKIMEYIRLARAQPDYNPNVRHCLYGLDADLIMLGLLSHDPHFCLLREEVKFGPARKTKGGSSPESQTFYLLHLSLLREYLDREFRPALTSAHTSSSTSSTPAHLSSASTPVPASTPSPPAAGSLASTPQPAPLRFPYSLERIIDDIVLLAVFVGNDFLPHLPDLHIHENGLERLFEVYKKVLGGLDGYINDSGTINTRRLQAVLDEMAIWEREIFEKEYADVSWFKGKQTGYAKELENKKKRAKLVLVRPQRAIFDKVHAFVLAQRMYSGSRSTVTNGVSSNKLTMPNTFRARERTFISSLAADLRLDISWDEYDEEDRNLITFRIPRFGGDDEANGNGKVNGADGDGEEDGQWEDVDSEDSADEEESRAAVDRVLKKYLQAPVVGEAGNEDIDGEEQEDFDARHERRVVEKMDEWKRGYYKGKLEISYDDPDEMGDLVFRYVEGLQWVMHYYYSGVASWGWFYDYHYAPRISDLRGVGEMKFEFALGTPFKPFQQLMGVLPASSKDHIPLAYQDLMFDSNSPILDFYPLEFEQDLNGKKQDWEAIVKIPFIDEKRLLKAMTSRDHRLTKEECKRNSFGTSTKFSYKPGEPFTYPSSLPSFFPPLYRCTCLAEPFDLPTLSGLHLVPGLCDGVFLGASALAGFPSLDTLPHSASLGFHGVNVHGQESRNKSMVIHIHNPHEARKTADVAQEMVGKRTFIGWPFLHEGMVSAVSDSLFKYERVVVVPGDKEGRIVANPHAPHGLGHWRTKAERIASMYSKKSGVITGDVEVLVHVWPLKGLKRLESGAFIKDYAGPEREIEQAVQMVISEVASEDSRFLEKDAPPLSEEFPTGSKIFFLGEHAYGVAAQVSATDDKAGTLSVVLAFFPSDKAENDKFKEVVTTSSSSPASYLPSYKAAASLSISGRALSKITSSFMVVTSDGQKSNIGLSLKFEAKGQKVVGYSRKEGTARGGWEYSEKALQLIREYKNEFPEVFAVLDRGGDEMARATDVFRGGNAEARVKEVKAWLKEKGVKDFEPVSLFSDQLPKQTVRALESLADSLTATQQATAIKKALVKNIPRHAVLKPSHAVYRLQRQTFALGDRVVMVRDSGGVPLGVKGIVVGVGSGGKSVDVLWDVPFMAGVTLGDRCSQYRGASVEFSSCLNLSNAQFTASTQPNSAPTNPNPNFIHRNANSGPPPRPNAHSGPYPATAGTSPQYPATQWQARPMGRGQVQAHSQVQGQPAWRGQAQAQAQTQGQVHAHPQPVNIMSNPHRTRSHRHPRPSADHVAAPESDSGAQASISTLTSTLARTHIAEKPPASSSTSTSTSTPHTIHAASPATPAHPRSNDLHPHQSSPAHMHPSGFPRGGFRGGRGGFARGADIGGEGGRGFRGYGRGRGRGNGRGAVQTQT
ncbi:exonuclease II [Hygrophoropsis aurantiaca]|uniref:Exonuclease II n=1 Tax=Hygrophoropsis aurantiaca TaxID=72124 RepID=A0ACB8A3R9_9AGAM|nr:exonuclease II [Hygrophoropsis aurantiaca]